VKTILPQAILEVPTGVFGQEKLTLQDKGSSVLGRAVAIHKFQDIGRQVPLYDDLCLATCGVKPNAQDKPYPRRSCATTEGKVKFADLGIQDQLNKHIITKPSFASYRTNTKFVVARYPSLDANVWYNVVIKNKPNQQTGEFDVVFNNDNACARRHSAAYLRLTTEDEIQMADPYGAAGPAIAGGIVGRMNPNQANDGKTSTGNTDATAPAQGITQISCYLRPIEGAGKFKIGGEALILQTIGTKEVRLQAKLDFDKTMAGEKYSFHFHDYGDLRRLEPADGDKRRVGQIYKEDKPDDILDLKVLQIPEGLERYFLKEKYTLPGNVQGVEEYVGRSLTIHQGPGKTSPTVSYGVCGIANPNSAQFFYTTTPIVYEPPYDLAATLGLSFVSFLVALF